jgi:ribonuclease HII
LSVIIGIDEAGRGPFAGPVVAAAVYIPEKFNTTGIKDSKKVSPKKREELYLRIIGECQVGIGIIGPEEIDNLNILQATMLAMRLASEDLPIQFDKAIVDGNRCPEILNCESFIKGDDKFVQISAASIIAKVTRDRVMLELAEKYPAYGFEHHKGYGTKAHMKALMIHGPIKGVHRFSFAPIKAS